MGRQAPRTRSFGGCITCRRRRMKCDETKPTCSVCRAQSLKCEGYQNQICFGSTQSSSSPRFRRPILTVGERRRMSQALTAEIPPSMALWGITQLDDECDKVLAGQTPQLSHGPFSVFSTVDHLAPQPLYVSDDMNDVEYGEYQDHVDGEIPHVTGLDLILGESDIFGNGDILNYPILTSSGGHDNNDKSNEWWDTCVGNKGYSAAQNSSGINTDSLEECLDFTDIAMSYPKSRPQSPMPQSNELVRFATPPVTTPTLDDTMTMLMASPVPQHIDLAIPHDAVYLLQHYSATVLPNLTPFRHSKTPWHILFLPHAKTCLATLTLGDKTIDDASLCAFFGTLALSALSLAVIHSSAKWKDQFCNYKARARHHVNLMLKTAYRPGPKTAKYKSMMLGLLTMVDLSSYHGCQADDDEDDDGDNEKNHEDDDKLYYLLETERLIRVKGFTRTKSRKVRLLHHCYVFERIVYESTRGGIVGSGRIPAPTTTTTTTTGTTGSGGRLHRGGRPSSSSSASSNSSSSSSSKSPPTSRHVVRIRQSIESSGAGAYSQDTPCDFVIPRSGGGFWRAQTLDQDMRRVKDQDEGENDLHLELPGYWSLTQYPEVFGIQERYIFLLALVIRLGRARQSGGGDGNGNGGNVGQYSLEEFMSRAKAVEKQIHLGFGSNNSTTRSENSDGDDNDHEQFRRGSSCPSSASMSTGLHHQHPPHSNNTGDSSASTLSSILCNAIQQALKVLFYRTVYDMEPNMLQGEVLGIKANLLRFEKEQRKQQEHDTGVTMMTGEGQQQQQEQQQGAARLAWPAFIGAREAQDPAIREYFYEWFRRNEKKSGLQIFKGFRRDLKRSWSWTCCPAGAL